MPPKYAASIRGRVTPIRPVRPPESARAFRFVLKPCSRTARSTASRVSGATSGRPLRTRETVAIETPAALATPRMVARLPSLFVCGAIAWIEADNRKRFRYQGTLEPEQGCRQPEYLAIHGL